MHDASGNTFARFASSPLAGSVAFSLAMALISQLLENPYTLQSVLVAAALVVLSAFYKDLTHGLPHKNIPVVGRGLWELSNKKAKDRFVSSARDLISQGFDQVRTVRPVSTRRKS